MGNVHYLKSEFYSQVCIYAWYTTFALVIYLCEVDYGVCVYVELFKILFFCIHFMCVKPPSYAHIQIKGQRSVLESMDCNLRHFP